MILVSVTEPIDDRLPADYMLSLTGLVKSFKNLQLEHILLYCMSSLKCDAYL